MCKGAENENRFSSTACLLRHEREAHGLHGHGTKPYLCIYPKCERSVGGSGFPRNYNLVDHMKRVHGYRPEEKASNPTVSEKRGPKSDTYKVRKRRGTDAPKRAGSSASTRRSMTSPASTLPGQDHRQQMVEFHACKDKLQQQLRRMQDPREAANHLQHLTREISQRYS